MIHPVHPEYGGRHQCFKCGSKFYDMRKKQKLCPTCGADQADMPSPEARLFASRLREIEEPYADEQFPDVEAEEGSEEIEDSEEIDGIEGSDSFDELEGEEDEEE